MRKKTDNKEEKKTKSELAREKNKEAIPSTGKVARELRLRTPKFFWKFRCTR